VSGFVCVGPFVVGCGQQFTTLYARRRPPSWRALPVYVLVFAGRRVVEWPRAGATEVRA